MHNLWSSLDGVKAVQQGDMTSACELYMCGTYRISHACSCNPWRSSPWRLKVACTESDVCFWAGSEGKKVASLAAVAASLAVRHVQAGLWVAAGWWKSGFCKAGWLLMMAQNCWFCLASSGSSSSSDEGERVGIAVSIDSDEKPLESSI